MNRNLISERLEEAYTEKADQLGLSVGNRASGADTADQISFSDSDPVEEGVLFKRVNGQLGLNDIELTCGTVLEVLMIEGGLSSWVPISIQFDGGNFYAEGFLGLRLDGLCARIRKPMK